MNCSAPTYHIHDGVVLTPAATIDWKHLGVMQAGQQLEDIVNPAEAEAE